jgi:hypothetical protein
MESRFASTLLGLAALFTLLLSIRPVGASDFMQSYCSSQNTASDDVCKYTLYLCWAFVANGPRLLAISIKRQLHQPLRYDYICLRRHPVHRLLLLQLHSRRPRRCKQMPEGLSWIPGREVRRQGRWIVHVHQDGRQALWYHGRLLYRSRDQHPCCYITSSGFTSSSFTSSSFTSSDC